MARTTPILHHNTLLFSLESKISSHTLFTSSHNKSVQLKRSLGSISFSSSVSSSSSSSASSCLRITRVSTAPVECAPPSPEFDFDGEIARLKSLRSRLSESRNLEEKIEVIDSDLRVSSFFNASKNAISRVLTSLDLDLYEMFLIKALVAAGQGHVLVSGLDLVGGDEFETVERRRTALKTTLYSLVEMIESCDVNGGESDGFGRKGHVGSQDEGVTALKGLLKTLYEVERFYDCIGGIIGDKFRITETSCFVLLLVGLMFQLTDHGCPVKCQIDLGIEIDFASVHLDHIQLEEIYQITILELLTHATAEKQVNCSQQINEVMGCEILEIHPPRGLDLSQNTDYATQAALWGVEGLPDLGEIYPLGGSADRLGLVDPHTGECLPAAMLPYCGRTLLEGLIRDLQAREFLYHKIYGKQCITPVAIMTSSVKSNHERITALCERLRWFGRGRSNFQLFEQPLVPAVRADDGQWLVSEPFTPLCKPGGHGVIWKLAFDRGIFKWFYEHGRKSATVRQVSNVVAATDLTMLALAGIGLRYGKKLGFASCKQNSGATEGINVLIEKKTHEGMWAYGISCIEYTEFDKFGIGDGRLPSKSLDAEFPANTNILYVDLASAELVGSSYGHVSLPGMVLNTKKPIVYTDHFGIRHSVFGGRLECTMQNIADNFVSTYSARHYKGVEDVMDTFLVYNERRRVTSSAKKKRRHGDKSLHQTPEGSLLDIMRNAYDLLSCCAIKIPKIEGNDKYINSGPPFLILLHPALGPLWEVIRQKFQGGSIARGSELQVEAAEFLWRNVQLDGSMIIVAENVMGSIAIDKDGEPILQYGHRCGKCKLQNVKVQNKGINWNCEDNVYWKHDVRRHEALKIILHGNAEFEAINVTLQGNHVFEVPDNNKMKITSGDSGVVVQLHPIEEKMDTGSWFWEYKIKGTNIELELVEL
ncbi:UDPGP family [Dillenia turbinata]|uniref:UDPGP family n=1 Tax=Dillenia turbinata TaxID=194707 RepID=A0AAN8V9V8_9MAGN